VSYEALALGANAFEIGLLASSFAAIAALAAIPLGRVIDAVGSRPVMAGGAILCGAACGLIGLADSIPMLAAAQAVLGLGQLMAVVGSHTTLATRGGRQARAGRVGFYTSAASLGIAVGPILAGLLVGEAFDADRARVGYGAAVLLAAGALGAIALMPSSGSPSPASTDPQRGRPLSVLGTLRRPGMLAALSAGVTALVANDLLAAYLPVYGEAAGISPQQIGITLGTLAIAQIASRLVLGRVLARFAPSAVLMTSLVVAGVGVPLLLLTAQAVWLLAIVAVIGAGLGLAQPLTLVWVVHTMPSYSQGLAMGIRMTGNRLGQLAIPVTVGGTAGQFGTDVIMLTIASLLVGATAFVGLRRRSLDADGAEDAEMGAASLDA